MKALQIKDVKELSIIDIPLPETSNGKVLIQIHSCGICGSDLHLWNDGKNFKGLILGHEFSGTVEDPGDLKETLGKGDNVTFIPIAPCGECPACKKGLFNICRNSGGVGWDENGGCSEYYAADPRWVRKLPDSISLEAAALMEPAAVVLHGLLTAGLEKGDKVLIAGAGPIGLLAAHISKALGADFVGISELAPIRLKKAESLGDADQVFDAGSATSKEEMLKFAGDGFDLFIDCTGVGPAINAGLDVIRERGKILLLGVSMNAVPINTLQILLREAQVFGSANYSVEHFEKCITMSGSGKINLQKFISRSIPIEKAQETFEELSSGKTEDVKVLIRF